MRECSLTVCFITAFNGIAEEGGFSWDPLQPGGMSTVTGWVELTGLEEAGGTSASRRDVSGPPETLVLCTAQGKLSSV